MKEYKVVPGPMAFSVANGKTKTAFIEFESIINDESVGGWRYHSMETITVTESGCMNSNSKNYYMLIFEREETKKHNEY